MPATERKMELQGEAVGGSPPHAPPAESLSFDFVYREYFPFLWRTARRLGVRDAHLDDVVQEIFMVVHRRLGEFEGRSSLRTWLYGIALYVVRGHRRGMARKSPHLVGGGPQDPDVLRGDADPHEEAARAEAGRAVRALLDALDDDKREVFVLSELEQLSAPEIAEVLGVNFNTVYSRLRAARTTFEEGVRRLRAQDGWRLR